MKKFLLASLLVSILSPAFSADKFLTSDPAAWRLQNYLNGTVVVWFTSSSCRNGLINFGPSATPADINRFWATVSIAKTSGKKMFVFYDDTNAPESCVVTSFGLQEE